MAPKWHDERILGTVLHTKSFCQSLLPYILESSSPKVISFTGVFAKMSKEMFRSQHQHLQQMQDSFQSFWPSRYHSFIIWLVHGWFGLVCVRMFFNQTLAGVVGTLLFHEVPRTEQPCPMYWMCETQSYDSNVGAPPSRTQSPTANALCAFAVTVPWPRRILA